MSVKITAPAAKHMRGEVKTAYGPTEVTFRDGVAELDELPKHLHAYFLANGYGIDGDPPAGEPVDRVDARDVTTGQVGTELRDAAVDPASDDFLAPVNAGEADPHGPKVVAPGIHAEGERVVAAGPVSRDPGKQDANESRLAEKLLIEQQKVGTPSGVDWLEGTGPLGLSDPLSAAEGVAKAQGDQSADAAEPGGNATREAWAEYAHNQGAPEEETAEGGLSRNELRAKYGS